jgi:hypothetical protein
MGATRVAQMPVVMEASALVAVAVAGLCRFKRLGWG